VLAIALPAASGGVGTVQVSSDAPTDAVFPIGETLVTVTAGDSAGATVACRFRVTVRQ
jgi:large repetitive protein